MRMTAEDYYSWASSVRQGQAYMNERAYQKVTRTKTLIAQARAQIKLLQAELKGKECKQDNRRPDLSKGAYTTYVTDAKNRAEKEGYAWVEPVQPEMPKCPQCGHNQKVEPFTGLRFWCRKHHSFYVEE